MIALGLGAALAGATGLAVPAAAQQAMPDAFSIDTGGWRGGAYARPDTMAFSHCGIARPYGETTLIFTRTPESRPQHRGSTASCRRRRRATGRRWRC